jgi:hypothetical protein
MSTREAKKATGTRQQPLEKKATYLQPQGPFSWQKSMNLVESVYRLSVSLPASEQWGLISQMRRAAVSIPSNIAEGYGGKQRESTTTIFHRPWFVAEVRNSGSFMSKLDYIGGKPCRSLAEGN